MTNPGMIERARRLLDAAGLVAGQRAATDKQAKEVILSKRSSVSRQSNPQAIWMETEAIVTDCRPELVRKSFSSLRIPADPSNVIVSFTYYAHARLYYDNFMSPEAKAKGETFSVYYNALYPRQNALTPLRLEKRRELRVASVLSFLLVSLLLLAMAASISLS